MHEYGERQQYEMTTAKQAEREGGLEHLEREIKIVSEHIDVLTERLQPVLTPDYPNIVDRPESEPENRLRTAAMRVTSLGQRLSYLASRVDL